MKQLVWLRSDLRTLDNTALDAALREGPTLAVWLVSPAQWRAHDDAACKVDFWLRSLASLREALDALNVPLLVRHCPDWSGAPDLLAALCREHDVATVHLNDEYGVHESRRDAAVGQALAAAGVRLRRHLDQLLFAPGTVLTQAGGYFQVFSQFRKRCLALWQQSIPACRPAPRPQAPLGISSDPLPDAVDGFAPPPASLRGHWPAGEREALRRLDAFVDAHLLDYQAARDFPAQPGTSQLSPYLAAGAISPRQCLHAALALGGGEPDGRYAGVTTWINELLWREFYKHLLHAYPRLSMGRPFRRETAALPWRDAPDELRAWQEGRTGFPLIDAAMHCLAATGWMHNRLRMVVAMFLTKNLLIDWREGERWFMRQLIDGDLAANNGGWQWSASTGTDAAPYFRLFNPVSQSEKFDPEGRFIRHWLPELAHLPAREIHLPRAGRGDLFGGAGYPPPMVDLAMSRERALGAFRDLPGSAS